MWSKCEGVEAKLKQYDAKACIQLLQCDIFSAKKENPINGDDDGGNPTYLPKIIQNQEK